MQVRVVGILGDGLVEIGQRLVEFEVVEVVVAFVNQTVSGIETRGERKGCEEEDSQYLYYKSARGAR